ncbi:CPS_collapsed_G0028770.mRNA.1.CDS.1 [Saccharomyces cerevisiae]|nr:CPS_collapsed_G0028770.mRNA.1.CDS.1 [Saccharomyces cerevisiae]
MLKRGKGCLNARYRISTGGCTDCGKSLGYSSAHNCGGKGYSCIKTCTEKNRHVCCEEWCGSKRAAQKERYLRVDAALIITVTVAMTTMMSFK